MEIFVKADDSIVERDARRDMFPVNESASIPRLSPASRLYFIVVFWGGEHMRYFIDILVASLLAPGNIPDLENLEQCRFLVCTTSRDWAALQSEPLFQDLESLLDVVFVEMTAPAPDDSKMLVMSRGHKILSHMAYEDGAVGVFLTPDLMLSRGSLTQVQRRVREGYKVVLVAALRFAYEGCIPEMVSRGFMNRDRPLEMSGREMMDIALRNLHTETKRYEWEAPHFTREPIAAFWRAPDGSGILLHSFSWAPLAVDYAAIKQHDSTTFDEWTLDGDYVYANFGDDLSNIHVVTDSDEIALVSFTKEAELSYPVDVNNWPNQAFWKRQQKLSGLRRLALSDVMDPLKRRILPKAVAWHGAAIDETVWGPIRERAGKNVEQALSRGIARTSYFKIFDYLWDISNRGDKLAVSALHEMLAICVRSYFWMPETVRTTLRPVLRLRTMLRLRFMPTPQAVDQVFYNNLGVGTTKSKWIAPQILNGKWYWEVHSPNVGPCPTGVDSGETATIGVMTDRHFELDAIGDGEHAWGWRGDGRKVHDGRVTPWGQPPADPSVVLMVAFDADEGLLWFGRDGRWMEGGNPAEGTGAAFRVSDRRGVYPALCSFHHPDGTAMMETRVHRDSIAYSPPSGYCALTIDEERNYSVVSWKHLPFVWSIRLYFKSAEPLKGILRRVFNLRKRTMTGSSVYQRDVVLDHLVFNHIGVGTLKATSIAPRISSGKWYWEIRSPNIGPLPDGRRLGGTATVGVVTDRHFELDAIGEGAHAWGWRGDGRKVHDGRSTSWGRAPVDAAVVVMVALDADSGQLWFGQDGVWMEAGDPAAGTGEAFRVPEAVPMYPAVSLLNHEGGSALMQVKLRGGSIAYSPPHGFRVPAEDE